MSNHDTCTRWGAPDLPAQNGQDSYKLPAEFFLETFGQESSHFYVDRLIRMRAATTPHTIRVLQPTPTFIVPPVQIKVQYKLAHARQIHHPNGISKEGGASIGHVR